MPPTLTHLGQQIGFITIGPIQSKKAATQKELSSNNKN